MTIVVIFCTDYFAWFRECTMLDGWVDFASVKAWTQNREKVRPTRNENNNKIMTNSVSIHTCLKWLSRPQNTRERKSDYLNNSERGKWHNARGIPRHFRIIPTKSPCICILLGRVQTEINCILARATIKCRCYHRHHCARVNVSRKSKTLSSELNQREANTTHFHTAVYSRLSF